MCSGCGSFQNSLQEDRSGYVHLSLERWEGLVVCWHLGAREVNRLHEESYNTSSHTVGCASSVCVGQMNFKMVSVRDGREEEVCKSKTAQVHVKQKYFNAGMQGLYSAVCDLGMEKQDGLHSEFTELAGISSCSWGCVSVTRCSYWIKHPFG